MKKDHTFYPWSTGRRKYGVRGMSAPYKTKESIVNPCEIIYLIRTYIEPDVFNKKYLKEQILHFVMKVV